ncbi:MAG: winged helix-turn-helix domain-containing protein [Nitrososphaeria archaeon]
MIDITIISDITTIIALILSIIAISYVINYSRKLKDIDLISDVITLQNNKIADIAWKIDLLSKNDSLGKELKPYNKIEPAADKSVLAIKEQNNENLVSGLEGIIINNLKNQELSSSEIQALVGKTREHVSRTLKKMVEQGTLERDESHKPYKYRLISKNNLK